MEDEDKTPLSLPDSLQSFDVTKMAEAFAHCGTTLNSSVAELELDNLVPPMETMEAEGKAVAAWLCRSLGVGEEARRKNAMEVEENKVRRRIRDRVSEILTVYVDTSKQGNPLTTSMTSAE